MYAWDVRFPSISAAIGVCCALGAGGCDPDVGSASREIVNGNVTNKDPSVVALVRGDEVACSGVLISDRVVLTAAHCVVNVPNPANLTVFFGSSLDQSTSLPASGIPKVPAGELVGVLDMRPHEDFTTETFDNDIGVVLLATPATDEPLPLLSSFDESFVGQEVRILGFGATSPTDDTTGRKREGTARIIDYLDTTFALEPSPSITCNGDSGGPALVSVDGTELVAGVLSLGNCETQSVETRVDAYADFIDEYLETTSVGSRAAGERCFYPENCASGVCLEATDAPGLSYCATPCESQGDCSEPLECADDYCRHPLPSPGALGTTCESAYDCEGRQFEELFLRGMCYLDGEEYVCTNVCIPEVIPCPDGFTCAESTLSDEWLCLDRGDDDVDGPNGCCQSGRAGASQLPVWFLLVMLSLRRRRERS